MIKMISDLEPLKIRILPKTKLAELDRTETNAETKLYMVLASLLLVKEEFKNW
jgi:hypothetical protein